MSQTEELITLARELLVNWFWTVEERQPEPNRLEVSLSDPTDLVPMVVALRVKRMGYLAAITGSDLGPEAGLIEVLYHFCTADVTVTLRVRLPRENAVIASLCDVIPSADVFERELSEMLGVTVTGLRRGGRLFLSDDWPDTVYPLRKDSLLPQGEAEAKEESHAGS